MIAAAIVPDGRHAGMPIAAQPRMTLPGRTCSPGGPGAVRGALRSREPTGVTIAAVSGAAGSARLRMT